MGYYDFRCSNCKKEWDKGMGGSTAANAVECAFTARINGWLTESKLLEVPLCTNCKWLPRVAAGLTVACCIVIVVAVLFAPRPIEAPTTVEPVVESQVEAPQ